MIGMYLQPVRSVWARVIGVAALVAALALAAVLVGGIAAYATRPEAQRHLTSSTVIFALVLVVLGGFCAQAGYRLTFNRPDRNGTLFSRAGWVALGTGLLAMAGLMAYAIFLVRRPDGNDVFMIVLFAAFGVWCLRLAWRRLPGITFHPEARRDKTRH
jgi:F0F1-type ATP synthase membrane subunit c/vacuolar-type H+-ATPase subunit K